MPERTDQIWICVDGVRGVAYRVDVLPSASKELVSASDVLPLKISGDDALGKGRALADWWARTRLFTLWAPVLRHKELLLLHKVYLVEKRAEGTVLRDSVSGESDWL